MRTPNALIAAARRAGTRVWAVTAVLLTTGALAAGCATTQASAPSGGSATGATALSAAPSASAGSAAPSGPSGAGSSAPSGAGSSGPSGASAPSASAGSAAPSGASAPSGAAGSSGPAAPVPTVSGGRVTPGEPACAGWPASVPMTSLPVSFVPVAVERCLNGAQTIPGKGLWQTASLQRADSGLDALVSALRQPSGTRQPDTACPMLAMIPPQVLLISATGQELIPRLPMTGCGLIQSRVLAALAALPWHLVSVRLIAAMPGASATGTVP